MKSIANYARMKGTEVQTLGARAVTWCMAGCLGHNNYYIMAMGAIIITHAHR